MLIGGILVVAGWVAIFLMAIKVIESSFWLNFLGYAVSVAGLFLGLKGAFEHIRIKRAEREEDQEEDKSGEKFRDWYK